MDKIAAIKHLYHFKKRKIRRLAQEFDLSRNTVRKIVQTEGLEGRYTRNRQVFPRLGPYQEALQELL